ncbi:MAG TPA: HDIG domain-containing protein [Bacilli bacterium]
MKGLTSGMIQKSFTGKKIANDRSREWRQSAYLRFVLFLSFPVMFYLAISGYLIPQTYDIKEGAISEISIAAPKTIYDADATETAKEAAADRVVPVYTNIAMKNAGLAETIFNKLEQLNADETITFEQKVAIYREEIPDMFNDYYNRLLKQYENIYSAKLLAEARRQLDDQRYRIPEDVFFKLPKLSGKQLTAMKQVAKDTVDRLTSDPLTDAQTARTKVAEFINASQLPSKTERELVQEISTFVITPNRFADEEATDEARAKAREQVSPVYIEKGQYLVKKGEMVTKDIFNRLDHLGLLKSKINYPPYIGAALLALLFAGVLFMFVRYGRARLLESNWQILLLFLIYLLTIAAIGITALGVNEKTPYVGFVAPVAMGTMLIAILLDEQIAFISAVLFGLIVSIAFNHSDLPFDFRYGFVAVVACYVSIFAVHGATQRSAVLRAGIFIALASCLAIGTLILLDQEFAMKNAMLSLAFAVIGGLLTAILVIGLLPFLEAAFGILSPLKMVELSNPNHPLLRKLLTETPGTYHHSVMVGNLAETAAVAINANGLLCRVGSFYHDIGKTKRPSYFIENQNNMENPHDKIDPQLSKSIIIAHARDGVEMLKEHNIPKPIRDIAEQHHGTTLLQYFYHKAKKQAAGKGLDPAHIREEDYRYPGPKAQTKEAAVVGIADSVEAAVRSLKNPTIEQIDAVVTKIVKQRLDDGQFNECDLTIKELDIITKTLNETLLGIFHSRIEYPAEAAPKQAEKDA